MYRMYGMPRAHGREGAAHHGWPYVQEHKDVRAQNELASSGST